MPVGAVMERERETILWACSKCRATEEKPYDDYSIPAGWKVRVTVDSDMIVVCPRCSKPKGGA